MYTDKRSKKIVIVAHCILNQNAKIDRCAYYPGPINEIVSEIMEDRVAIIQLPCPEVLLLGLRRGIVEESEITIEDADDRVAKAIIEKAITREFTNLVVEQVNQFEEYHSNGFALMGLIGVNGSPTCGVETNWSDHRETIGNGVFISAIIQESAKRGIWIKAKGIKANDHRKAIEITKSILR